MFYSGSLSKIQSLYHKDIFQRLCDLLEFDSTVEAEK